MRTASTALLAILIAGGAACAQDARLAEILPATPGVKACFARTYDAKHLRAHPKQRVTAVTFLMRSVGFDSNGEYVLDPKGKIDHASTQFAIRFVRRDMKQAQTTSGDCQQGETAGCYVECDGGGFKLEKSGEGLLLRLMDDGIRIDDCDEKDVRLKPGADDRAFRVDKVADAQCAALEKAAFGE